MYQFLRGAFFTFLIMNSLSLFAQTGDDTTTFSWRDRFSEEQLDSLRQVKDSLRAVWQAKRAERDSIWTARRDSLSAVKDSLRAIWRANQAERDSIWALRRDSIKAIRDSIRAVWEANQAVRDSIWAARRDSISAVKDSLRAVWEANQAIRDSLWAIKRDSIAAVRDSLRAEWEANEHYRDSLLQVRLDSIRQVRDSLITEWRNNYVAGTVAPNPVPAGSQATLTFESDAMTGTYTLVIYSSFGVVQSTTDFTGNSVNLPVLEPGYYFYRISGSEDDLFSGGRFQVE